MLTMIHSIMCRYTYTVPLTHATILIILYSIMDAYKNTVPLTHTYMFIHGTHKTKFK